MIRKGDSFSIDTEAIREEWELEYGSANLLGKRKLTEWEQKSLQRMTDKIYVVARVEDHGETICYKENPNEQGYYQIGLRFIKKVKI